MKEIPNSLLWVFESYDLKNKRFLKDLEFIKNNTSVNNIAISVRNGVQLQNIQQCHSVMKELVEHAHKLGLKVSLHLFDSKGFYNSIYQTNNEPAKLVVFSSHQMSYVEEFCDDIAILNRGEVVLGGDLKEIKREFGKDRLVLSALGISPMELAQILKSDFSELLSIEKVQKNQVVIRKKQEDGKLDILKRLIEHGIDLEFFGLYEPSLNDIFVEMAGDE